MTNIQLSSILELSPKKRFEIAEIIWDSLEEHPEELPLTNEEKLELDKRLKFYYDHKEESLSWAVVKEQILTLR